MATLNARLAQLRSRLVESMPTCDPWPAPWDTLVEFEKCADEFADEPDFAKAVQFFRQAMEQALAAGPSTGSRIHGDPNKRREPAFLEVLRLGDQFPDVPVAYEWLSEMRWRLLRGIPPVGEAEFAELSAWFEANEERLDRLADSTGLFDVGCDRRTCCWHVRAALRAGPRAEGAGEAAEDIRQLQARYGNPQS